MSQLVQYGKYGSMNTIYTKTMGYCEIKFVSESYTLQEKNTCDVKISTSSGLVFKAQYLICIQENTYWYWGYKQQKQSIIVPT